MNISLIASSVRPHLWKDFFDSLEGTKCSYEVVFAGDLKEWPAFPNIRYIPTARIKPAQCYEVARREAKGDLVMWVADDCEFSYGLLDNIVKQMDILPEKTLISVKTNENGQNNVLDDHRFFDGFVDPNHTSPLMAPLGVIRRSYLEQLGGFDRRYLCGQYENDVAMRVYVDGGQIVKYEEGCVFIDHIRKHGESTKFWSGYNHDRRILEDTWAIDGYKPVVHKFNTSKALPKNITMMDGGNDVELRAMAKAFGIGEKRLLPSGFDRKVSFTPLLPFESYTDENLLTKSQSYHEGWA